MKELESFNDDELIALIIDGSSEAYKEIHNRYYQKILNFLYHRLKSPAEAEDQAQNTFMRVWEKIQIGQYRSEGSFPAWIFRIAYNFSVNHFRSKHKKKTSYVENFQNVDLTEEQDLFPDGEYVLELLENDTKIIPRYRYALKLQYIDGYTLKETGEILNTSLNNVKTYRFRGMKHFKKEYAKDIAELRDAR